MSRQNRPGGGASARPAGTDGGPPVRRAVALPSVGDDAEQALRPAPRRGTATTDTTALGGTGTTGEAGRDETETTSSVPATAATAGSGTASAPGEPEARAETTAPGTDRRERPETAADAAAPARTTSRGGAAGALSGLAAVLGGARRSGGAGAGNRGGDGDGDGSPGRPKAPMLAAAGIAGVILIAVPLLVMAGNERDEHSEEHTTVAADSRALGDQQEAQQPPDVYVAESPKDESPAVAAKDGDGGKEGKTAKDGGRTSPDGSPSPSSAADGASPPSASQEKESVAKAPAQLARKTVDKPVTIASARIVSADTGKCLTAPTRGVGSELVVQPCGDSEGAQVWAFHTADQTLRIGQDLCMGLDGGSVDNGTAIRLQQCNGSAGQKFKINATEDLVSLKAGNKCADVWWGEGANGTPVKLWPCTGTANQTWRRG